MAFLLNVSLNVQLKVSASKEKSDRCFNMPTLHDVAKAAGVSIATVSATINQSAYVSPELQERVRKAIAELSLRRPSRPRSGARIAGAEGPICLV